MIVVIGSPAGRYDDGVVSAAGTASRIALAAAAAGRSVQLVGKVGDDPAADAIVIDLARGGVGHVAVLRDPGLQTPAEPSESSEVARETPVPEDDVSPASDSPASGPPERAGTEPSSLDAVDVDLGLRYLTDFQVVVLAEPAPPEVISVVAEAAAWGDARMILIVAEAGAVPDGLPADVVVFEAPPSDPDGAFATVVGAFAAALDDGAAPEVAFRASIASDGWTGTPTDAMDGAEPVARS